MSEVPHFARDFEETWWEESVAFADDMVPGALLVALDPEFPVYVDGKPRAVIASGPSPRGEFLHAILVSGADGTLIWDPHPSRAGLAGPIEEIYALTL